MLSTLVRKTPALVTVIPLIIGIIISYYSGFNISALPFAFFVILLCVLGIVSLFIYGKIQRGEIFLFSYCTVLILFGIFSFQLRYFKMDSDNVSHLTHSLKDKRIILTGVISEQPEIKENRVRLIIDVRSVEGIQRSGTILATIYKYSQDQDDVRLQYGDIIRIEGKLEDLPHRRNPGEFDYGQYLKMHNISAVFTGSGTDKIELTGHIEPDFYKANVIIPVKKYSIKVIDEFIGGDEGEYLKGLVLGERSNISKELKENFINAGVAHIIAVSGLNVAYVIIIIWGVLLFLPFRFSYKVIITLVCLLFYMNLTGNTPSIIRATIMASVFLLSQIIERKPNPYNIISFAALVIQIIDPRQLFDAGFILSFTAILSIVILYPRLEKLINKIKWYRELNSEKFGSKIIKWTAALFLGTLAAQIGTLPITAIMFKKISIISLAANLFAIPLSNLALGLGFVMIIASLISSWLASVFGILNSFLLFIQLVFIEVCARLDYAFVETYFVDWMLFAFYYAVIILTFTITHLNYKARLVLIMLVILNFFVWKSVFDKTNQAELTYIDVGGSNCTMIKMPEGTSILINSGSAGSKYFSAERNIIPYLKSKGISRLDLLVINSLNYNEFRNLKYLVENFSVSKIILPVYYKPVFENKEISRTFKNVNTEFLNDSKIINRHGKFRLYLYYDKDLQGESILTEFVYGFQRFLFSDSYTPEEDAVNSLLLRNSKTSVLKPPGAGSFDYTSAEFLTKAGPEYVVLSQSKNSRKKLNTDVFDETLKQFGMKVFKTGDDGAVIFRTDGFTTYKVYW
jgi:competence protein ComEC